MIAIKKNYKILYLNRTTAAAQNGLFRTKLCTYFHENESEYY